MKNRNVRMTQDGTEMATSFVRTLTKKEEDKINEIPELTLGLYKSQEEKLNEKGEPYWIEVGAFRGMLFTENTIVYWDQGVYCQKLNKQVLVDNAKYRNRRQAVLLKT